MEIVQQPLAALAEYARIPIAFTVDRVLDVVERDGGVMLSERAIASPYEKDYDAIAGNHPDDWPRRLDVGNWTLLAACENGARVGGAVVAFDTPSIELMAGRSDVAVLWDLRVEPRHRRRGVGAALFRAAEQVAMSRRCRELHVETQNVNVAACRFYERQGCRLREARRDAYPELPHEIQLIWCKELGTGG